MQMEKVTQTEIEYQVGRGKWIQSKEEELPKPKKCTNTGEKPSGEISFTLKLGDHLHSVAYIATVDLRYLPLRKP